MSSRKKSSNDNSSVTNKNELSSSSLLSSLLNTTTSSTETDKLYWLWILQTVIFVCASCVQYLEAPDSYFSNRQNHLNIYFVKRGWGWTLIPLLLFKFALFAEKTHSMEQLKRSLARLGVATVFWWLFASTMDFIKYLTGKCENPEYAARHLCLKNGHAWDHVDISGHSFMLSYAMFVIWEEISPYFVQSSIQLLDSNSNSSNSNSNSNSKTLTQNTSSSTTTTSSSSSPSSSSNSIISLSTTTGKYSTPIIWTLFTLLWLWMLMLSTTALYFHTWAEKFTGLFIGQLSWYLTYNYYFLRQPRLFGTPRN